MNYIILIFIFFITYMLSDFNILFTESFVLFLSFSIIWMSIYMTQNGYKFTAKKEYIKWKEIMLFYTTLKYWNRFIIRDRSVKIANFLDLVIQIKKYEIIWLKKILIN